MATYTGIFNTHDTFTGTSGADTFINIQGGDTVDGKGGEDTISVDLSYTDIAVNYDAIAAATATGTEPLWYMSVKNVEHLALLKTGGGNDSLTISAAQGAFEWQAGAGTDTLRLDFSNATAGMQTALTIDACTTSLNVSGSPVIGKATGIERVEIQGSQFADWLVGTAGDDILKGGDGDDTFSPGGGKDTIDGGAGFDRLVNLGLSGETASIAYDAVKAASAAGVKFNGLSLKNLEGVDLTTGSGDDTLTVSVTNRNFVWIANGGRDQLIADYSASTAAITVSLIASTPLGPDLRIHSVEMGGANADAYMIESLVITGSKFDDTIVGTAGNDSLNGGLGNDILAGGKGDDLYHVDGSDTVTEDAGSGTDAVYAWVDYTLGANVEKLVLQGTNDLNGYGNAAENTLTGNSGNNVLDGRAGADTMDGAAGNDSFHVDNAGDIVLEAANCGTDTVFTALATYTLGENIENLVMTSGKQVAQAGYGNALANTITGTSGNNILDGKSGADTLKGGAGNDAYYVDDFGDKVIEDQTGGLDGVITGLSFYALGEWIEDLTLTGAGNSRGTGNDLGNRITGNSGKNELNGLDGNDRLDGGAGADVMNGGKGDDIFYVDNAGDVVGEYAGEGTDLVYASLSFSLAGINAENLALLGTGNLTATGNGLVNVLTGNAGRNVLDGKAGADTMAGGAGNDTYYVDNVGDTIIEASGDGHDVAYSSVSYTLGLKSYVQELILTGTANLNATGNNSFNDLVGNSGRNILNGLKGDDTLTGNGGADTFLFGVASGKDTITDFSAAQNDRIDVSAYHAQATAIITQHGADTWIDLGGGNVITVQNVTATDTGFLSHIIWS